MAVGDGLVESVTCSNPELFDVPFFAWGSGEVGIVENEVEPNEAEVEAYMVGENANKGTMKAIIEFCWEMAGW